MGNDKMREEFESWHKTEVANFVAAGQMQAARVLSEFKQTALAIWEASRAAVVVELPAVREIQYGRCGNEYDSGVNFGVELCREAIEAAGLQVKP
ncbi:hypothetical protein ASF66_00950 [Pseudomonas sp. Leaf129]|uniref:hypothetical protein n=1 Tax=Pseudomonas sp. Leaf129 TaxID=1736268 RepID=UPI000703A2AA|nr:hypothetical protein [Pseudomonas sp. Leaf129]KQQ62953.1 hypothetical protein ASF66_00950 [Pseudomonas sp. Leaf129]